nr:MAG TPA: hypothetical protein [Caudoviricetes sp.]
MILVIRGCQECIDIFRISFNMYKDFYYSWDLVKDYLKNRISLN